MKVEAKRSFFVLAAVALLACLRMSGQEKAPNSLYTIFDKAVQAKNSGLNNGKIHFNPYRSIDKTHRYYGADQYVPGAVFFDGQFYSGVALKYDELNDELVVKLDGETNQMGFSPVKAKTAAFDLDGLRFVNLDRVAHPDFASGFYEETQTGTITLYTKHSKNRFEVLTNERVFNRYIEKYNYIIYYKNNWYEINSWRDAVKAFPSYESSISDFYQKNSGLEKSDENQFMKKLAAFINNLVETAAEK